MPIEQNQDKNEPLTQNGSAEGENKVSDEAAIQASLEEQVEQQLEKISDLEQRIKDEELRALANVQNIFRRHKKELEDAHKYASFNFAKEMLTIKDYLEMALLDKSGNFEAMKMGVEMTLKHLNDAFNKTHINEIDSMGEALDPNKHNCIRVEEVEDAEPNKIVQVLQKGYEMNDRVLRPAMVVVSKGKE